MKSLRILREMFITEDALTKGSQRVMADKKMVANLADSVRDDVQAHPQNFPPGSKKTFLKAPDEEVAKWFLGEIDKIEREGYEGTIYSRDGAYSEWIVRRYIAGSHNFEDIVGVMNMNMRDWALLKNRNMLQPTHSDIPKFSGVRDLGKYMTTHYHDKLEDVRSAARAAAVNKMAKRAKIVDNEDYSIYTVFNWAAARALGLGTQWCTANSQHSGNYNNYSNRAMLFQLFPKEPEHIETTGKVLGKPVAGAEKYQFDAGTPCFHDIADDPAPKDHIKEKFPYIYTDLVKGLTQYKTQLEASMKEMAEDPALSKLEAAKTKVYDVDEEIKKLKKLENLGYFTDKVRPKPKEEKPESEPESGAKELPPPPPEQPQGNPQMENVDKDVKAMLDNLKKYDILKESVLGMVTLNQKPIKEEEEKKEWTPPWLKDKDKDKPNDEKEDKPKADDEKEEVDEGADQDVIAWMKRFDKLGRI